MSRAYFLALTLAACGGVVEVDQVLENTPQGDAPSSVEVDPYACQDDGAAFCADQERYWTCTDGRWTRLPCSKFPNKLCNQWRCQ